MTRFIYMLLFILPFLITGGALQSMPPHPDLLEKWGREGTLEKNIKSVQGIEIKKNMNSSKASSLGTGTVKIPVILVSYSGTAVSRTTGFFSDLLNGVLSTDLSVKKYFIDMSDSMLTVQFDIYGPVAVSGILGYYGANTGGPGTDAHPGELVYEAVTLAKGGIDFSQYDNNGDGYVDCVIIIHAGAGEEDGAAANTIWSHQWDLASAHAQSTPDGGGAVSDDGKTVNVYTIQPEFDTGGNSTIGVFCHELGHVFGLPDLYDYTNTTYGVGDWSLMANGSWAGTPSGSHPAPLLAWERFRIGGRSWLNYAGINPVSIRYDINRFNQFYLSLFLASLVLISFLAVCKIHTFRNALAPLSALLIAFSVSCSIKESSTVIEGSIDDIEVSHKAYRIPLGSSQYLYLEGKTADSAGWYVPGTGVLVTHVHEGVVSQYFQEGAVNDGNTRVHGVNVVEADGSDDLWSKTDKGGPADLYCSENNDSLTVSTTPDSRYYTSESLSSKTGDSGVSITSFTSKAAFPITFHAEY